MSRRLASRLPVLVIPPEDEEAFLFPNRDGSFIDPSNYRKRVLHKLVTELGLPKLTFQVIRRTIATLAQKKGTVKDVQGVMRQAPPQSFFFPPDDPEALAAAIKAAYDKYDQQEDAVMQAAAIALFPERQRSFGDAYLRIITERLELNANSH